MRILLNIIILFVPYLANSQSIISSDSVDYGLINYHSEYPEHLGKPNLDSLSSEIRIWISGHYASNLFIKISKSKQGEWAYRRGFIDHGKKNVVILPKMLKEPNIDSLWQIFKANKILSLPDQQSSTMSLTKDGVEIVFDKDYRQKVIDMPRGELYIIEVYSSEGYRQYGYHAPDDIHKICVRSNIKCEEHEMMNNIVTVLNQNFQIKDLSTAQLKSIMKKNIKR